MRNLKLLTLLAFTINFGAETRAVTLVTLSQTNSFALSGANVASLSWNRFNPSLGTLTGITFGASFDYSGSFTAINNSSSARTVSYIAAYLQFNFFGQAPGDGIYGLQGTETIISTSPSSGTTVPGNSSRVFTILSGQTLAFPSVDWVSDYRGYFTGTGTVDGDASVFLQVSGSGYLPTNTSANGSAILTYTYQVPEPSALSLLAVGLGLVLRRSRRTI